MKVRWSALAIQRVQEAAELIALDKPGAAVRWADSIFDATESLAAQPNLGRAVPELGRPDIRELIRGAFRIIYRVGERRVSILTVRRSERLLDLEELATEGS